MPVSMKLLKNDSWSPKIGSSSIKLIEVGSGSNIKECKGLDNELEAARKMIEDLNWVKVHNESKIHNQELKIQELQVTQSHSILKHYFCMQLNNLFRVECHLAMKTKNYRSNLTGYYPSFTTFDVF